MRPSQGDPPFTSRPMDPDTAQQMASGSGMQNFSQSGSIPARAEQSFMSGLTGPDAPGNLHGQSNDGLQVSGSQSFPHGHAQIPSGTGMQTYPSSINNLRDAEADQGIMQVSTSQGPPMPYVSGQMQPSIPGGGPGNMYPSIHQLQSGQFRPGSPGLGTIPSSRYSSTSINPIITSGSAPKSQSRPQPNQSGLHTSMSQPHQSQYPGQAYSGNPPSQQGQYGQGHPSQLQAGVQGHPGRGGSGLEALAQQFPQSGNIGRPRQHMPQGPPRYASQSGYNAPRPPYAQSWDPSQASQNQHGMSGHAENQERMHASYMNRDKSDQDHIQDALRAALESAARGRSRNAGGAPPVSIPLGGGVPGSLPHTANEADRPRKDDLARSLASLVRSDITKSTNENPRPPGPNVPSPHPDQNMPGFPASQEMTQRDMALLLGELANSSRMTQQKHKPKEVREDYVIQRLPVICNGNKGIFLVGRQVIVCLCEGCVQQAKKNGQPELELSPTDFERHSGSCTSKKWKYTVKVLETNEATGQERPGISVGIWLDRNAPESVVPRGRRGLGYSSILGDVAPPETKVQKTVRPRASRKQPWSKVGSPASPKDGSQSERRGYEAPQTKSARVMPTFGKNKLASDQASGDTPPPEIRKGANYQAEIPEYLGRKPEGAEKDDPRSGEPGPVTLEALAIAASYEKDKADQLAYDATADPDFYPGAIHDPKRSAVERGQRVRKKPKKWAPGETPLRRRTAENDEEETEEDERPTGRASKRTSLRVERKIKKKSRSVRKPAALPKVVKWEMLSNGYMSLEIHSNGKVFNGTLHNSGTVEEDAEEEEEETQAESEPEAYEPSPKRRRIKNKSRGRAHSVGSFDDVSDEDVKPAPPIRGKRGGSTEKPRVNEKRRLQAQQEFERLADEGFPPDTRCALCHQEADPDEEGAYITEQARGQVDFNIMERKHDVMGPMLLVKSSAIMNAWVHLQCVLWSPEVYVNQNGDVERASEAIRRGRMLKCKCCNEKGATLGCHKRSCRASYHLPCARENGCTLEGAGEEDYLVTCREHATTNDLVELMPVMPDARDHDREQSRQYSRNRSMTPSTRRADARSTHNDQDDDHYGINDGDDRSPEPTTEQGAEIFATGWNQLPRNTQNLDTLTAAAIVMRGNAAIENAANPLAAHHFGGTVGQSNLRPGRCAVCVVQRKGVCGTLTAPRKCLRRLALDAAGRDVPEAPASWRTRRPMANWPAEPARSQQRVPGLSPPANSAPTLALTSGQGEEGIFSPNDPSVSNDGQASGHHTGLTPQPSGEIPDPPLDSETAQGESHNVMMY